MGHKINNRVKDSAPNCPNCKHQLVYTEMWHHLYWNKCNCMCNENMMKVSLITGF